ncbi:His Kinase A (phospho-acceptor) domain-containing protein [Cyclonatronum proteinivorum]|uniref:histidine kinase n=1 Tax=Cyclonatronum proteinivorum TaxID=1457365 RepID=A0A345UJA3_9BACT|nr:His Kinase A (phospho-acceptor) domain-containing protein [Cyclonatronum proteinivorum]
MNVLKTCKRKKLHRFILYIRCCVICLLFASAFTDLFAQPVLSDQSPLINTVGTIRFFLAEEWQVSAHAPEQIADGINLKDGIAVPSLHLDSLRTITGDKKYGWAELSFIADSTLSDKAWFVRNFGYAAVRVWINGKFVFQDGTPSPIRSGEVASRVSPTAYAPANIREGVNYILVEFSWNTAPQWLYSVRTSPEAFVRPIFSEPQHFVAYQRLQANRSFMLGAVIFVLLLLSVAHIYLSTKSVDRYHYYAFWVNISLMLHACTQMGDAAFYWSVTMIPAQQIGHVVLFLFVFYNIIFTIGTYYRLSLPQKSLRIFFGVYLLLSMYAVLFQYELIYILHPILAILNLAFAVYLLQQTLKKHAGIRASIMFVGFFIMLLGAFAYAVLYQIYFPTNTLLYYLTVIMVYMVVPVSFTITITLDFVEVFEQTEQKVIERTKELREKDEFKSRFFLNVSHELRTPTTILEGLLQKAAEQSGPNSEIRIPKEDSSLVMRNAKRLVVLVNQILDLSKSDKGKLSLQKKHYRLDDLIQNVIDLNTSFIALRFQKVEFNSNTSYTIVNADGEKVSTILSNVLINASKYGPEHSLIRIETRVNNESGEVEIDIKDEGEGVGLNDREIIFERFHRLKTPDKPYVEGLGIGLDLGRSLARLHDGNLVVVEDEDKGARFRLTLPFDYRLALNPVNGWEKPQENGTQTSAPEPAGISESGKVRLLLVEDNPDMNAYVKGLLHALGSVHSCKNGAEALAWLQKNETDIVVTDLMMPVMTGEELIRHMASDPKLQTIPIVVLSAKDNAGDRLHLLRVGIIDYITKPFNASELRLKIENLMRFYQRRKAFMLEVSEDDIPGEISLPEKVKNYVLDHIDDSRLSASALADAFSMSERSFYRKIEKESGMTPAAFIREVRLQYAARIVENSTDIRLNELAGKIGYKSADTFKRNYVERFGVSPNEIS